MMKTQNKMKVGIGVAGIGIIALYTYFVFRYGGDYLSSVDYIAQTVITGLFLIPLIMVLKFLHLRSKTLTCFIVGLVSLSGIVTLSEIVGKTYIYNFEMLTVSLWPLLCYGIAKWMNIGNKIGFKPSVFDFIGYNVIVIGLVWLFEEVLFKYAYLSSDVVAEMYMYVIAVITFILYNLKGKRLKVDKWDIICFVMIMCAVTTFWVCKHERVSEIIESIYYNSTDVDADGEFINWLSHRFSMLQASFNGDFSGINIHRVLPMVNGCSLAWLSSVGGAYVSVVLWVIIAAMAIMLIVYVRNKKDVMISVIAYGFVLKTVIGAVANMFLIFSTSVGVPFIKSSYDLIPFAILLFLADSEKNKRPYSNLEQG